MGILFDRALSDVVAADLDRATSAPRACLFCRWWQEDREDQRSPRWGACLRPAGQPPALFHALAEDEAMGARLMTHPKHYCAEFDS